MDVLIVRLTSSGFGSYLRGVYFGCLMFCWCYIIVSSYCVGYETCWRRDLYAVDYDVKFNSNKLCGRPHDMSHPCKLTFDLLTLKVVSESRVTRATSVPTLVFL